MELGYVERMPLQAAGPLIYDEPPIARILRLPGFPLSPDPRTDIPAGREASDVCAWDRHNFRNMYVVLTYAARPDGHVIAVPGATTQQRSAVVT